jgi:hypothetical protein
MRAGELAHQPETVEHKQRAQQSPAEPWQSAVGKKTKNVLSKGKTKASQDLEALDDFFEGDDSGSKGAEVDETEERNDVVSVPAEVPTKRRRDKSTTRLDQDFEPVEKHSKKAQHKKHRGQTTAPIPIVQDRFFDDDDQSE